MTINEQSSTLVDVREACDTLGIKHMVLRKWFKLGAPYQLLPNPHGGLPKYYCDPREIYAWVRQKQFAGELSEHYLQGRVAAEDAHQILVHTKETLGLTTTEVAQLAEVPRKTVHRILYWETYRMKSFAKQDVTRIEMLIYWVEPRRKRGQKPSPEQVRHALQHCKGIRNRAYKYLGIEYSTLHDLIDEYGLKHLVDYRYQQRNH